MGNVILDIGVGIVTLALMFSVGLSLKPDSLLSACHPLSRMAGHLAVTSVIPPLAGLATVLLLSPPPTVATAILLISACPVGDISNVYALIARADTGRSLAINVTSVLAAPLTMIPVLAVFHVLGYGEGLLAVPAGPLLLRLFLLLILPVSIGALVGGIRPRWAARHQPKIHLLTSLGIVALLLFVVCSPAFHFAGHLEAATASLVFIVLCTGAAAISLPAAFRQGSPGQISVLLSVPVRNVAVAVMVAIGLLGRAELATVFAIYFALEVILLFGLARFFAARGLKNLFSKSSST